MILFLPVLALLGACGAVPHRFGPLKRFASVGEEHDVHWVARDTVDKFEMVWHLHAEDQNNVDSFIRDRSDPNSPNYLQWANREEAANLTRPDSLGLELALQYLHTHGITRDTVSMSFNKRSISFNLATSVANQMLGADYRVYHAPEEPTTKRSMRQVGTRELSIPSNLHKYVAIVYPGSDFAQFRKHNVLERLPKDMEPMAREQFDMEKRIATDSSAANNTHVIGQVVGPPSGPPVTSSLNNCWHIATPQCLKAFYHIPNTYAAASQNTGTSIGTLNLRPYQSQDSDIHTGLARIAPQIPSNYLPTFVLINVPGQTLNTTISTDHSEPDGDLQIVIPQVYPIQTYNFEGPNLNRPVVFSSVAQMGQNGVPRPDVLSVSYGAGESSDTMSLCQMTDAVVAQGTTLVCSSGDNGYQDMNVPALCPHWVSVGAAMTDVNNTVTALQVSEGDSDGFTYFGSGGFSFQRQAPESFQLPSLVAYKNQYTDPTYGSLQLYAATPDVSAQGRNIIVYISNGFYRFGGTSASSPLFAAQLGLINAGRKAQGKTVIGNPRSTFYGNSNLWRDVVSGNNYNGGLSTSNTPWPAKTGWDPSTGLGTPLFDRLNTYYMNAA